MRIVVSPVDQSTQVIPLVHATYVHAIAHPDRDAPCEIDVVGDQECFAVADIDDESLVTRALIVVRQQSDDETAGFDPGTGIALFESL